MGNDPNERAKGKRRAKPAFMSNGEWQGFVDIVLSEHDKAQMQEEYQGGNFDFGEAVLRFLRDGYKLSLSPDFAHGCIVASATGKGDTCPNVGYSLTARGPDAAGAVLCLFWKCYAICEGRRWADVAEANGVHRQLDLFA